MSSALRTTPESAKRTIREILGDNTRDYNTLQVVLQEVMTDALRASIKEVVKEAVREVHDESTGASGQRGQKFIYFGVGAILGYLAASGRLPTEEPEVVLEEAQSRLPTGPEENSEQKELDEAAEEETA